MFILTADRSVSLPGRSVISKRAHSLALYVSFFMSCGMDLALLYFILFVLNLLHAGSAPDFLNVLTLAGRQLGRVR